LDLDRQSIEKRDFPIGRRGYEPTAVDDHLAKIAREVQVLKRSQGSAAPHAAPPAEGGASLASIASAQVQAIVEAAESGAAAIERDARKHAAQTAQDAAHDAQRTRDQAIERSQQHVGKVHEAIALMLQRVDAMESELSALVEALRTGGNRLNADLSRLSGNMGELYAAADGAAGEAAPATVEDVVVVEQTEVVAVSVEEEERELAASGAPPGDADGPDIEGARLIALNMALNGQPRTATDKYLAENFDLGDRDALLDDVYATVEG
jgi:vacuolar-type H+-ATPase subunit E/Vma4